MAELQYLHPVLSIPRSALAIARVLACLVAIDRGAGVAAGLAADVTFCPDRGPDGWTARAETEALGCGDCAKFVRALAQPGDLIACRRTPTGWHVWIERAGKIIDECVTRGMPDPGAPFYRVRDLALVPPTAGYFDAESAADIRPTSLQAIRDGGDVSGLGALLAGAALSAAASKALASLWTGGVGGVSDATDDVSGAWCWVDDLIEWGTAAVGAVVGLVAPPVGAGIAAGGQLLATAVRAGSESDCEREAREAREATWRTYTAAIKAMDPSYKGPKDGFTHSPEFLAELLKASKAVAAAGRARIVKVAREWLATGDEKQRRIAIGALVELGEAVPEATQAELVAATLGHALRALAVNPDSAAAPALADYVAGRVFARAVVKYPKHAAKRSAAYAPEISVRASFDVGAAFPPIVPFDASDVGLARAMPEPPPAGCGGGCPIR